MKIYLIRHARQISRLCNDNTGLCKEGVRQAELAAERLSRYSIGCLYSSDLLRAVETAEIINTYLDGNTGVKLEHRIRMGLREADFGELTGLRDEVIAERFAEFMENRFAAAEDWRYPGGENGSEVAIRAMEVLNEILVSGTENTAVVTHGGTIRCLLSLLFQKGQTDRLVFGKQFRHGSITEIYYEAPAKRFYLERFNDYAHLEC